MFDNYIRALQLLTSTGAKDYDAATRYSLRAPSSHIRRCDYDHHLQVIQAALDYVNSGIKISYYSEYPTPTAAQILSGDKTKNRYAEYKEYFEQLVHGAKYRKNPENKREPLIPYPGSIGLKELLELMPRHVLSHAISYVTLKSCKLSEEAIEHDVAWYFRSKFREFKEGIPFDKYFDSSALNPSFQIPPYKRKDFSNKDFSDTQIAVASIKQVISDLGNALGLKTHNSGDYNYKQPPEEGVYCNSVFKHETFFDKNLTPKPLALEIREEGLGTLFNYKDYGRSKNRTEDLESINNRIHELLADLIGILSGSSRKSKNPTINQIAQEVKDKLLGEKVIPLFANELRAFTERKKEHDDREQINYDAVREILDNLIVICQLSVSDSAPNPIVQQLEKSIETTGINSGFTSYARNARKAENPLHDLVVLTDLNNPAKHPLIINFVERVITNITIDKMKDCGLLEIVAPHIIADPSKPTQKKKTQTNITPEQSVTIARFLCERLLPDMVTSEGGTDLSLKLMMEPFARKLDETFPQNLPPYLQYEFAKAICAIFDTGLGHVCEPPTAIAETRAAQMTTPTAKLGVS